MKRDVVISTFASLLLIPDRTGVEMYIEDGSIVEGTRQTRVLKKILTTENRVEDNEPFTVQQSLLAVLRTKVDQRLKLRLVARVRKSLTLSSAAEDLLVLDDFGETPNPNGFRTCLAPC